MSSNSDSERVVADRYVLRRELGRGGMGVVWEAFDPSLDRVVAIKQVLLPDHFTDSEREDAHARVRREAQSAARISHPTVITIHDVLVFEGNPWVVMELVEGCSLQDMLNERGTLDADTVATIAESLLKAVRSANAAGVLHRDIKPGNIMMSTDGRVILTDFGIATMEGGPSITRTGALIGSPEYMPPERLEGGPAEHRGDLWSIGVTLFAAIEGTSPFRRDSITAAIAAVVSAPLPPMTRAGWLEPVISGLLERDPDRRLSADGALAVLRERGSGWADANGPGGTGAAVALGPASAAGAGGAGGAAMGPAGLNREPYPAQGMSGPQYSHQAPSGGYPAPGTGSRPGPYPGTPPPPGPGPTTPYPGRGPAPHGYAHPPGPMHGGGHGGGPTGTAGPVRSGGHGGGGRGSGLMGRALLGLGAGAVALLLIAVVAAALIVRSNNSPGVGDDDIEQPPVAGAAPTSAPSPDAVSTPDEADDTGEADDADDADDADEGDGPPPFDTLTTFHSQWFNVGYPDGWRVDDSEIDNTLAVFIAPGNDQQVWVTGWTEEEFTGTSAEYLEETNGGTNAADDVTTGFERLGLEEVDTGDYPDAWNEEWDVALVEADLANDTWPTPERRFWAYAISFDYDGSRIFYLVSVNVPRGDSDYYDDLHEDVAETFDPHV